MQVLVANQSVVLKMRSVLDRGSITHAQLPQKTGLRRLDSLAKTESAATGHGVVRTTCAMRRATTQRPLVATM